jgi:hypothetical protein
VNEVRERGGEMHSLEQVAHFRTMDVLLSFRLADSHGWAMDE